MTWWKTFGLDLLWLVVFAALGRLSHGESADPGGVVETGWPFAVALCGMTAGLAGFRRATETVGSGALIWLGTVLFGMLIRLNHGSTAQLPFIIVATMVIGLGLVGWRVLYQIRRNRHG